MKFDLHLIDETFAKEFHEKMILKFKPKIDKISYWSFYAHIEDLYGYSMTMNELLNKYNLTIILENIDGYEWYEYDDFIQEFTERIVSLLNLNRGHVDNYADCF